jgi:hypothetical protein
MPRVISLFCPYQMTFSQNILELSVILYTQAFALRLARLKSKTESNTPVAGSENCLRPDTARPLLAQPSRSEL